MLKLLSLWKLKSIEKLKFREESIFGDHDDHDDHDEDHDDHDDHDEDHDDHDDHDEDHDDHDDHDDHAGHEGHNHGEFDAHIWLDPSQCQRNGS